MDRVKQFNLPASKLRELGVAALYLFGSQAQGAARATSDFDFGILLHDTGVYFDTQKKEKIYFELFNLLSDQIEAQVNLDIVFLDHAPIELQLHVVRHGRVLYGEDHQRIGRFRQKVLEEYADFEPHRRQFQEATLARID